MQNSVMQADVVAGGADAPEETDAAGLLAALRQPARRELFYAVWFVLLIVVAGAVIALPT